jgi:hypothetical protein
LPKIALIKDVLDGVQAGFEADDMGAVGALCMRA